VLEGKNSYRKYSLVFNEEKTIDEIKKEVPSPMV
jgi:hypothetical protein